MSWGDSLFQKELIRDMQWCLSKHPDATPDEKRELLTWVKTGFSPSSNPYFLYNDDGFLMDFIDGIRIGKNMCKDYATDPEGFREKWISSTASSDPEEGETDSLEDLPF